MSTTTGEILKQARERAGLTQKALGIALGYNEQNAQSMVTRWETDSTARTTRLLPPNEKPLHELCFVVRAQREKLFVFRAADENFDF